MSGHYEMLTQEPVVMFGDTGHDLAGQRTAFTVWIDDEELVRQEEADFAAFLMAATEQYRAWLTRQYYRGPGR